MSQTRKIQTTFAKGEISPLLKGRPDLVGYNEGCETLENFVLLKQGVAQRRVGLRYIGQVKDSNKDTILVPFEAGLSNSFVVEVGSGYMRFFKDKARLLDGSGNPVEIVSPYNDTNLRGLHFTQSVDVMFFFQRLYRQKRLNRINDQNWTLTDITHRPPPSFEKDVDISDPALIGVIGGGQGLGGGGLEQPGGGGVDGGGDSGTDGGDGGGGDGGGE